MANRTIQVEDECPYCGGYTGFRGPYNKDVYVRSDIEWVLTKRKTKQYFHRSCYKHYIEGQKRLKEKQENREVCRTTGLECIRCNPGACDHRGD